MHKASSAAKGAICILHFISLFIYQFMQTDTFSMSVLNLSYFFHFVSIIMQD